MPEPYLQNFDLFRAKWESLILFSFRHGYNIEETTKCV